MSKFEILIFAFVVVAWSLIMMVYSARREVKKVKGELAQLHGKLDALLNGASIKYDPFPNLNLSHEVQSAVLSGRKIEAIKLYRRQTGVGLAESKRMIESIMP